MRLYYRKELDNGATVIDDDSVNALVKAMRNKDDGRTSLTAAMWWQKSRMGWSDRPPEDPDTLAATPVRVTVEYVGEAGPVKVSATQARPARPLRDVDLVGDER
jgi:hypothetical protein